MKASFALPLFAQAADDTSTLLSLKVQTTLETGVDHLLDAVGSRNVTQMASLLQNLVEETISQDPEGPAYGGHKAIDPEVSQALTVIKNELIVSIQYALKEAHCYDQAELHQVIQNFEQCDIRRKAEEESCPEYCDGMAHKGCRDGLFIKYQEHITECRALDDFMKDFEAECPVAEKKCCLLSHTTWNCGGLCSGAIHGMDVDAYFGTWLQEQITKFESAYHQWTTLHGKCTAAYHAYVELDAKCDCMQAECETTNCQFETCRWLACEDNYQRCWARMLAEWERTNTAKECLEKDRKIDWSATEKIECYVDVLLASPTEEELLATCGTADCINKWRETHYKHCNTICPEVDFESGDGKVFHERREERGENDWREDKHEHRKGDQDVTAEGGTAVLTKHRAADGSDDALRCTAHLDLDYQLTPCCTPCEERPQPPCGGEQGAYGTYPEAMDHKGYLWLHYGQFGHFDSQQIESLQGSYGGEICHSGEHCYSYAYNLCTCIDCPAMPYPPPQVCPSSPLAEACTGYPAAYDYSQHDLKCIDEEGNAKVCSADDKCAPISDSEGMQYTTNHEIEYTGVDE